MHTDILMNCGIFISLLENEVFRYKSLLYTTENCCFAGLRKTFLHSWTELTEADTGAYQGKI